MNVNDLFNYIRTEFRNIAPRELLHHDIHALLGVGKNAADALKTLEINTIFDLATSQVFNVASKLVYAGTNLKSALYQYGAPTADMVRDVEIAGKKISDLQFLPISILQNIPKDNVANIESALDVKTVRDLALYPPYIAAIQIMNAVYFPENVEGFDPERPTDLLPKTGEYPTERVQYNTLLMDEIKMGADDKLVDLINPNFKPLNLSVLAQAESGFKRTAFGALLTFNQSWYAQGVTLGQLLHSTSLAPGESTRIAVVDWSRKSRAGETEVISESDELTNDTSHNRSITEVTQAVANEAQGGFSSTDTNSTSNQSGLSMAGELSGGLVGSLLGGPSFSAGASSSTATSQSHADSYSTSWGHHDIGSTMMQNVNDRTHQHAHSNRSRRASVVKEVSQSEHEGVSTRVIANYNHMHSLTIQYYEVVQVYRVEVALVKADRVVFIPIQLIDFNNDDVIHRFQSVLAANSLSFGMREALYNLDVIAITPDTNVHFTSIGGNLKSLVTELLKTRTGLTASGPVSSFATKTLANTKLSESSQPISQPAGNIATMLSLKQALPAMQQINTSLWSVDQVGRISGLVNRAVLRPNSSAIYLPTDVNVEGGVVESGGTSLEILFHTQQGKVITKISSDNSISLSEVDSISLKGSNADRDVSAAITLTINRNGVRFPLELPAVTITKGTSSETLVVQVKPGGVDANLKKHLNDNKMYYSQTVFRSLDSTQIALLLSGYGLKMGEKLVPVSQMVEPRPIRYIGNYLAFKMNSDVNNDPEWAAWIKERGINIGSIKEDIVPLGTGGVFSEAVLGRSNSAEKLDITRFWNWQDSPIPLQPTEIAAIQTGSRATPEDVKPGNLSNPIINITSPTSLPDPTGTAAILSAIQNGNMFRDMSGLQATIGLAQAALQASAAGAATAGQQAGTNMQNHLQAQTERMRIAADLAKAAISAYTGVPMGGGSSGGGSTHSQDGAKINYFDKTKGQTNTTSGDGGKSAAQITGTGSQSRDNLPTDNSSGGGSTGNGVGANNPQFSQNPGILAATWGDSQPKSTLMSKLVDSVFGGSLSPTSTVPLSASKAWPKLDRDTVLSRLNDLKGNANLFNQGAIGLCTAAAFFHHVIQKKPSEFYSFATALYGSGMGFLGKFKVSPGSDLRNTDYSELASKYSGMPPPADWMLMSAVRDSENWFFDFEGSPDENIAMDTSAKEMSGWYQDTGFYSSVDYSSDTNLAKIKTIQKLPNNQIAMWINIKLLGDPRDGTHMITIESPITIDEAANKVTFDYWTWGQPVKTLTTTVDALKSNYLGVIVAKF